MSEKKYLNLYFFSNMLNTEKTLKIVFQLYVFYHTIHLCKLNNILYILYELFFSKSQKNEKILCENTVNVLFRKVLKKTMSIIKLYETSKLLQAVFDYEPSLCRKKSLIDQGHNFQDPSKNKRTSLHTCPLRLSMQNVSAKNSNDTIKWVDKGMLYLFRSSAMKKGCVK